MPSKTDKKTKVRPMQPKSREILDVRMTAAVLRWIESTSTDDSLVRAIKQGKGQALSDALNGGAARIKPNG
jgi:hypothetical protein